MMTDEELAQLPEDPELAFVEFEKVLRARVDDAEIGELCPTRRAGADWAAN